MIAPWFIFYLLPTNVEKCRFISCVSSWLGLQLTCRMEYGPRGLYPDKNIQNCFWLVGDKFWMFIGPDESKIQHSPNCKSKVTFRQGTYSPVDISKLWFWKRKS